MSFEKRVLNQVRQMFARDASITSLNAYFEYGTLFLEDVSSETGRKIIQALEKDYKIQYNIYNPVNGFVIDFVA